MRAMILAAGRGERMGALTQTTPKPLLRVNNRYLIEYAIQSLKRAGIYEIVINTAYLGDQIKEALGSGEKYNVQITYSSESERLETGGGIFKALPLLGKKPFIVMSSDIITDYPIENLLKSKHSLAHLILVDNPKFHPEGDFGLYEHKISYDVKPYFTFANIGLYDPSLFANCVPGYFRLAEVLKPAIAKQQITGELYQGAWFNVGTPEDLQLTLSKDFL